MKRRAVILSMVLSASLVLTGCSWSEIKSKFTGEDSSTTSTASQDDDYVASECVSIPEYKGIEVDCTVSDDEVHYVIGFFAASRKMNGILSAIRWFPGFCGLDCFCWHLL